VVFTSQAADSIISAFSPLMFSGASRFEGTTPMSEGLDLGNDVSLSDDPTIKESGRSIAFDDEGLPKGRVRLLEGGVVKNFLYNAYWSSKASRDNTNSASRPSFTLVPGIDTSNLVVSAREESDVAAGSFVVDEVMGVHSGDPTTGSFSVVASVAWDGRKGRTKGVRGLMITGNFVDFIKGIKAMSRDKVTDNATITGDLMVAGLSIS
jgi:predicted Zn-dependent protease